ncbi:MAG TPA: hypothetical protein VGA06_01795 [Candidatus Paceibacterota bacterium]|jgi:hypothetical protein
MLSRLALVTIAGGALVVTSACSTNVSELEKLELHDSLFAGLAPALVENQLRLRNSGLSPTTAADTISLILPPPYLNLPSPPSSRSEVPSYQDPPDVRIQTSKEHEI